MQKNYDDIINLPRHISKKHPQMSLEARSAQFAPFAALTGYDEAIRETARQTEKRIEINEEVKRILNEKLQLIKKEIQKAMLDIKNKYGKNAILKGMNLQKEGTTIERNSQIGGHKE